MGRQWDHALALHRAAHPQQTQAPWLAVSPLLPWAISASHFTALRVEAGDPRPHAPVPAADLL